jgi:hypothetical protein
MTLDLPNVLGLIGSAIMVAAFAYSNMAKPLNLALFNALNLAGAILLICSLAVHFNLASMALEIVWAVIAALGLLRALTVRA